MTNLALLALVLVPGCGSPAPVAPIVAAPPRPLVGTPYGRDTGYAIVGATREAVPSDLSPTIVLDEATVATQDASGTCIDLTLRTARSYDDAIADYWARCRMADQDGIAPVFGAETVTHEDFAFLGDAPTLEIRNSALLGDVTVPVGAPEQRRFTVVTRQARVCCPGVYGDAIVLTMRHPIGSFFVQSKFVWGA